MPSKVLVDALTRLGEFRWWLLGATALGAIAVAALLVFVPSNLGFAAAGPLVMVPWSLFLVALGFRPGAKDSSLKWVYAAFFSIGIVMGLTWPAIVLLT